MNHGLVELQLSCPGILGTISITKSPLAAILAACSGLRIFYFGVELIDLSPSAASVGSVHLEELEGIELASLRLDEIHAILRLVAPGEKRLQLAFHMVGAATSDELSNDTKDFLARSNISKLRIRYATSCRSGWHEVGPYILTFAYLSSTLMTRWILGVQRHLTRVAIIAMLLYNFFLCWMVVLAAESGVGVCFCCCDFPDRPRMVTRRTRET